MRFLLSWTWLVLGLCAIGCSSGPPAPVAIAPVHEQLMHLGAAYQQYCSQQMRPPQKPADLEPFLTGLGQTTAVFTSLGDGQPFVICWGTDLNAPVPAGSGVPVLAYERTGTGGQRYVLSTLRQVERLSEAKFRQSTFPAGHTPAP